MFIGHFGIALAAKPAARRTSLGTLFLAAQLIDLLWPSLLLLGLESVRIEPGATRLTPLEFTSYPISHSLLLVLAWAALFALGYFLLRRERLAAMVCGALVVSHWLLDLLVHKPDLPLAPVGTARIGLGLWNHPGPEIALELGLFAAGVWLYLRSTRALDRVGSAAFWGLAAALLLIHFGSLLGPPPPSVSAIAWVGQAQWLLVAWAYWVDRHRRPREPIDYPAAAA